MIDELEWIKIKLIKMAVIDHMTADIRHQYEKMGLFETLQIKSLNMYGHKDTIGFSILHNKTGLYGWKCGEETKIYYEQKI